MTWAAVTVVLAAALAVWHHPGALCGGLTAAWRVVYAAVYAVAVPRWLRDRPNTPGAVPTATWCTCGAVSVAVEVTTIDGATVGLLCPDCLERRLPILNPIPTSQTVAITPRAAGPLPRGLITADQRLMIKSLITPVALPCNHDDVEFHDLKAANGLTVRRVQTCGTCDRTPDSARR